MDAHKPFLYTGAACIILVMLWHLIPPPLPALAQIPIQTPTAGPDGRIIWIVKAGDSLLSISLITGVPVETLRAMNNLTGDNIIEGQKLLLGLGGPVEITYTPGPTSSPTPLLPTPSPKPGVANLCVILFNDRNGDSLRQEAEPSIPGGAINVNNRSGSFSKAENTGGGSDPICFKEIPEGDYTISVAVPVGFNATTDTNYAMKISAGDETYLDFGAQPNAETQAQAPAPTGSGRSPLLGIIGGLFLAAGLGLAIFASRLLKGH